LTTASINHGPDGRAERAEIRDPVALHPPPAGVTPSTFAADLHQFITKYMALWQESGAEPPSLGEPFDPRQQQHHERHADAFIKWSEGWLKRYPASEAERTVWRERLIDKLKQFSQEGLGFPERCVQILFSPAYRRTTAEFLRQAKAFDPTAEVDSLFQALRNVWIGNSLQILLDREVTLGAPIFAYSLLYPYTDNYLDNPHVPQAAKQEMDDWLGRRLNGVPVAPGSPHETAIVRLVDLIDGAYPADAFPEVHLSLRAIHRAQTKSLRQQRPSPSLSEMELLRISVEKGGTSVLADGYLVAGRLTRPEADFMFGYGVLLQLLDDLQDLRQDLQAAHVTLFTAGAKRGPLDPMTNRLYDFMERVLRSSDRFANPRIDALSELIQRSCSCLILHAVAANSGSFSAEYLRWLESHSRFSFAFVRDRRQTAEAACKRAKRTLERERNLESVLGVLG
jgi:hypothetical protein